MSAAAPPPPPTPSAEESNPSETKPEKNDRSEQPVISRTYSRRSGPSKTTSPKVATPTPAPEAPQEPTKSSSIWPWLQGKLEKKPSSSPAGEGSASSKPAVSEQPDQPPVLAANPEPPVLDPTPISAIAPAPENPPVSPSTMVGMIADATSTELIAVYDPFYNCWYYLSVQAYAALFGQNLQEKLPEEDKIVEENVVEEKEVEVDPPTQITPKINTILIGDIEVPLPLDYVHEQQANVNPTGLASSSSSSSKVQDDEDEKKNKKADEEPAASIEEHRQQNQKKKKKKKKNKGKKN